MCQGWWNQVTRAWQVLSVLSVTGRSLRSCPGLFLETQEAGTESALSAVVAFWGT